MCVCVSTSNFRCERSATINDNKKVKRKRGQQRVNSKWQATAIGKYGFAATVGERAVVLFFTIILSWTRRWTGLRRAGGQAGGLAGCLAISIKWLALKISGRTIKTPFHSGSVKQARQGRREQGALGMGVGVAKAYCPQLPLLCVTKSNNKPIKRPHTIKMAATTFLLPTFWGSQCISGLSCCSPSSCSQLLKIAI